MKGDFEEDIREYKLVRKRMTGTTLKFFFEKDGQKKVLELVNIAAFIDDTNIGENNFVMQARDGGCTYGLDMSMYLKRPEVNNFYEVFLFSKSEGRSIEFRALAEHVAWRDYDNQLYGDANY